VLTATASSLVDRLADAMYKILDGAAPPPAKFASVEQIQPFAGTYDLTGTKLKVTVDGKRLYIEGPGEPRHRMSPISDHEFWIEALQSAAIFDKDGDKVARVRFVVGDHALTAPRVE
jgi:hypothetical protein